MHELATGTFKFGHGLTQAFGTTKMWAKSVEEKVNLFRKQYQKLLYKGLEWWYLKFRAFMKKIPLIVLSLLLISISSCFASKRVILKGSLEGGLFLPGISHLEYYVCLKYKSDLVLIENLERSSDFVNYANKKINDIEAYNLLQRKAIHMQEGCNSSEKDWDKFNSEIWKYDGKKFALGFPSATEVSPRIT